MKEFRQRVNAELVNNLGNLANRTLSLLAKPELGKALAAPDEALGKPLVTAALARVPEIRDAFLRFDHRAAVKADSRDRLRGQPVPRRSRAVEEAQDRPGGRPPRALRGRRGGVPVDRAARPHRARSWREKLAVQLGRPRLTFAALEHAS